MIFVGKHITEVRFDTERSIVYADIPRAYTVLSKLVY